MGKGFTTSKIIILTIGFLNNITFSFLQLAAPFMDSYSHIFDIEIINITKMRVILREKWPEGKEPKIVTIPLKDIKQEKCYNLYNCRLKRYILNIYRQLR